MQSYLPEASVNNNNPPNYQSEHYEGDSYQIADQLMKNSLFFNTISPKKQQSPKFNKNFLKQSSYSRLHAPKISEHPSNSKNNI